MDTMTIKKYVAIKFALVISAICPTHFERQDTAKISHGHGLNHQYGAQEETNNNNRHTHTRMHRRIESGNSPAGRKPLTCQVRRTVAVYNRRHTAPVVYGQRCTADSISLAAYGLRLPATAADRQVLASMASQLGVSRPRSTQTKSLHSSFH